MVTELVSTSTYCFVVKLLLFEYCTRYLVVALTFFHLSFTARVFMFVIDVIFVFPGAVILVDVPVGPGVAVDVEAVAPGLTVAVAVAVAVACGGTVGIPITGVGVTVGVAVTPGDAELPVGFHPR